MSDFTSVLSELNEFTTGKKSYLVSILTLAATGYLVYSGQMTIDQAMPAIATALGISTLRHGITTSVSQAGAAIVATRDPAVAASPSIVMVNAVASAIVNGALDHVEDAATPPPPPVALTPAPATPTP